MATVTKANLETLFTAIEEYENTKKDAADGIKEAFELFATQYGEENSKALKAATKDAYKKYKKMKKNRAQFILVESETDQLTERMLEDD